MNRTVVLSLAAALVLPISLPLSAQDRAPEVTRKGRTVVMYKDAAVQAVLGYRWVNAHPEATWIPLQLAISSSSENKSVDVAREDISLVTPSGERISLPSQKTFQNGARQASAILEQVSIAHDPIAGYFPGRSRVEPMALFTVQNAGRREEFRGRETGGLAYDRFSVDRNTLGIGLLWFPLPAGVLPGRYHLEVENKWAHADIPFDVPAPPLGKGTDEGITW